MEKLTGNTQILSIVTTQLILFLLYLFHWGKKKNVSLNRVVIVPYIINYTESSLYVSRDPSLVNATSFLSSDYLQKYLLCLELQSNYLLQISVLSSIFLGLDVVSRCVHMGLCV